MAASSSKGRGRTRSRASASRASRSGGATRRASQSRTGRAGSQSSKRKAAGRSRAGSERDTARRRKPAARSRAAAPAGARSSRSSSSRRGAARTTRGRTAASSRSRSARQPRRGSNPARRPSPRVGRTSRAPRTERRSAADPIALLTQDHRHVAQLFEQFETARDGKKKRAVFEKIRNELELHARLEEEVFYPEAESRQELEEELREAHGEHNKVKQLLREAEGLDPESGEFDATVAGIQGAIEHHVEEEEQRIFPVIRESFSPGHHKELAQRMQRRRGELKRAVGGNAAAGRERSLVGRLMGR